MCLTLVVNVVSLMLILSLNFKVMVISREFEGDLEPIEEVLERARNESEGLDPRFADTMDIFDMLDNATLIKQRDIARRAEVSRLNDLMIEASRLSKFTNKDGHSSNENWYKLAEKQFLIGLSHRRLGDTHENYTKKWFDFALNLTISGFLIY